MVEFWGFWIFFLEFILYFYTEKKEEWNSRKKWIFATPYPDPKFTISNFLRFLSIHPLIHLKENTEIFLLWHTTDVYNSQYSLKWEKKIPFNFGTPFARLRYFIRLWYFLYESVRYYHKERASWASSCEKWGYGECNCSRNYREVGRERRNHCVIPGKYCVYDYHCSKNDWSEWTLIMNKPTLALISIYNLDNIDW